MTLTVRRAGRLDCREMADILNEIIARGGTTAMTTPVTPDDIRTRMEEGRRAAWHVAETEAGEIVGFQWINEYGDLPPEAASIATFARVGRTGLGIGSALFTATCAAARALGYAWICADIRADNDSGLTYYQSRGFETYAHKRGIVLEDGTVVDKVLKRYDL